MDWTRIIEALIGALPAIIAAIASAIFGWLAWRQSKHTGHEVNSRMDELRAVHKIVDEETGRKAGVAEERQREQDKT